MDLALLRGALAASPTLGPASDGAPEWLLAWRAETASTQDDALELASRSGRLQRRWLLVGADRQRSGRGRSGATWHGAERGVQITLGHELEAPLERWPLASLVVGAGLAERLAAATGADVRWKWPNDLLAVHQGRWRKLGGCLAERRERPGLPAIWLIGVGLNVGTSGLPAAIAAASCGLDDLVATAPGADRGGDTVVADAVAVVADAVRGAIARWQARGFAFDAEAATARLAFVGDLIRCDLGSDGVEAGRLLGLHPDGRLRVEVASGAERAWLPTAIVGADCAPPWQAARPPR